MVATASGTVELRPKGLKRRQRAAYLRLVVREPLRAVARRFRVRPRTVQRWVADVLARDDTVSLMLRAAAERPESLS